MGVSAGPEASHRGYADSMHAKSAPRHRLATRIVVGNVLRSEPTMCRTATTVCRALVCCWWARAILILGDACQPAQRIPMKHSYAVHRPAPSFHLRATPTSRSAFMKRLISWVVPSTVAGTSETGADFPLFREPTFLNQTKGFL